MLVYQRVCCKKDTKLASGLEAQKPKNPIVFELCKAHVVSQHLHIFFKVSQPHRQRAAHMLLSLLCVCPLSLGFEIVSVQLASAHLSLVCLTFLFLWLIIFLLRFLCSHICKLTYVMDKPQPCLPDWSFTLKPVLSFFHTIMHWLSPSVSKSARIPLIFCWLSKVKNVKNKNRHHNSSNVIRSSETITNIQQIS